MESSEAIAAGQTTQKRTFAHSFRTPDNSERTEVVLWLSVISLLTLIAGALRFANLKDLGFSIDEGFTLTYSRQSWYAVLGLDGFYSPHPPLSFAAAKLFATFLPEEVASRSLSAVTGTLTMPILILLVDRLADRRVAIGAGLLLTISPIHIEYSRMGRMYAPVLMLIALSYFLATLFWQTGRNRWLVPYVLVLAAAMYTDYSAAYALVPQAALVMLAWRKSKSLGIRFCVAIVIAGLAYLPWVTEIFDTVRRTEDATGRASYLAASWTQISEVVRFVPGITGARSSIRVNWPSSWDRWTGARPIFLIALIPIATVGMISLRRVPHALLVALLFVIGTPLTAIVLSQVSPGFATRTVLAAVLGWVILASGWLARGQLATPLRGLGLVGWCFLIAVSIIALPPTYGDARHPQWPLISKQLADQAYLGKPILIFSTAGMLTDMVDLYEGDRLQDVRIITLLDGEREFFTGAERWLDRGITLDQLEDGALGEDLRIGDPAVDAFWFIREFGGEDVLHYFVVSGYNRIGMTTFFRTDLELWARSGANLGGASAVENGAGSIQLRFSSGTERYRENEGGGTVFQLSKINGRGIQEIDASEGWYTLSTDAWTVGEGLNSGGVILKLKCVSASGEGLSSANTIVSSDDRFGAWTNGMIAVYCPQATVSLSFSLTRSSETQVSLRRILLYESHPHRSQGPTS